GPGHRPHRDRRQARGHAALRDRARRRHHVLHPPADQRPVRRAGHFRRGLTTGQPMKLAKVSTSHITAVTGTTFVSTLSSLLFGYATAIIAGAVGAIDHNFIVPRGLSNDAASALLGFAVCSLLVGTIIGALIATPMA